MRPPAGFMARTLTGEFAAVPVLVCERCGACVRETPANGDASQHTAWHATLDAAVAARS